MEADDIEIESTTSASSLEDKDIEYEIEKEEKPEEEIVIDTSFVEKNGQFNITLSVENHKIHVSKAILCVASPVFKAMLELDFKEKDQAEIELPGKRYKDVAEFLSCIYPDRLKIVTEESVYDVLPLTSEYQVQVLQDKCEEVLIEVVKKKHHRNISEVFRHIQLAELYKLEKLLQRCLLLASEFSLADTKTIHMRTGISDKSLIEMKNLALMRYELDRHDDYYLFQNYSYGKQTYQENIKQCIQQLALQDRTRAARLHKRYFPEDTALLGMIRENSRRQKLPFAHVYDKMDAYTNMPVNQQCVLLPECVKQQLDIKESAADIKPIFDTKTEWPSGLLNMSYQMMGKERLLL